MFLDNLAIPASMVAALAQCEGYFVGCGASCRAAIQPELIDIQMTSIEEEVISEII